MPTINFPESCPPECRSHGIHVYVLCYGRPVIVRDCDRIKTDPTWQYPKTHYVGITRRLPITRIREHGNLSAHHIAVIVPGGELREMSYKLYAQCPQCNGSLWYYAESPTYDPRIREYIENSFTKTITRLSWAQTFYGGEPECEKQ